MEVSFIFIVGLIFFLGYIGGLASNRLGLPKISGYVLIGIILSPSATGLISSSFIDSSSVIVDFALAMVAYDLGGSLIWRRIRQRSRNILYITAGQGLGAFIFVFLGSMMFLPLIFPAIKGEDTVLLAFIFGAISLSTAPAATIATIHEYKAVGRFTSMLLSVVALDDALGLLIFALTVAFLKYFLSGEVTAFSFVQPFLVMLYSIVMGGVLGVVLSKILKRSGLQRDSMVIFSIAFFCLAYGLAQQYHLEPLLATMAMGTAVSNLSLEHRSFKEIERNYEPVVFALFFVLAGAHIDVALLVSYLSMAVVFVFFRMSGKWAGTFAGGSLSGASVIISRYMGLGLAPQAGIAIGLSLYLQGIPQFEQYSLIVVNVIIAKTAINEIIGPYLLKYALNKAGNIRH